MLLKITYWEYFGSVSLLASVVSGFLYYLMRKGAKEERIREGKLHVIYKEGADLDEFENYLGGDFADVEEVQNN